MKNKSVIKRCVLIFASAAVLIYGIILGYVYGFWGHFTKMNDKDFRTVYEIVCKNTDIRYQKIDRIIINNEYISIYIKQFAFPYSIVGIDLDSINFNTMVNIYDTLSEKYKNKILEVHTGIVGSSDSRKSIVDGSLLFSKDCSPYSECNLKLDDVIEYSVKKDYINAVNIQCSHKYQIDLIEDLPTNTHIKYFRGFTSYTDNFSAIKSFQGLETLDLSFINDNNSSIVDLGFVNDLPELNNLTIYADSMRINVSDVSKSSLKAFTFYTNSCSQKLEKQLSDAFPNAEISIVCDYYDLYSSVIIN